jgi:hypothetical protein
LPVITLQLLQATYGGLKTAAMSVHRSAAPNRHREAALAAMAYQGARANLCCIWLALLARNAGKGVKT